ncbi:MAG: hypothetical protein EPO21_05645 [Chloroflexota bacterium]|nr:MAG: hypothetical protein EPO21_05645 [Chloroflexota bacterium]
MRRKLDSKAKLTKPRISLEVFVAPDCPASQEARTIAGEMRERFPALAVDLIVLDGRRPAPRQVVATPTYLLDGEVISLGNPRREALAREVALHGVRERRRLHLCARQSVGARSDREEEKYQDD